MADDARSPLPSSSRKDPASAPGRRRSAVRESARVLWQVMRANPLTLVGFVVVAVIVVTALLVWAVPFLTGTLLRHAVSILPYDPNGLSSAVNQPPSLAHPFGTDPVGADMFSKVLSALPTDLLIGLSITAFALLLGGSLGLIAGYWDAPFTAGGVVSAAILRVTDIFLAFPSLILALAVAATLGRNEFAAILAIMVTWWPYYVRLTRGEVLAVKHQPYVQAARAAGVSDLRILGRHIVRNVLEPLTVYYTLDVGTVLVTFSTISFVGIGVPPSIPEWGNLVEQYQNWIGLYPWTVLAPGLAIFVTVLAFSLLGDGLRDILDPRSRRILAESGRGSAAIREGSADA